MAEDALSDIEADDVIPAGGLTPTYVADQEELDELASIDKDIDNNVRIPMSLWVEVKHFVKRRRLHGDKSYRSGKTFVEAAVLKALEAEREKDRVADKYGLTQTV